MQTMERLRDCYAQNLRTGDGSRETSVRGFRIKEMPRINSQILSVNKLKNPNTFENIRLNLLFVR